MSQTRIRLDHPVTTPLLAEVREAMLPFLGPDQGLPSLLHQDGLRARDAIATAREQCAGLIGARSPDNILFTASGTEAVNLAIQGLAASVRRRGNHFVLAQSEHPAVARTVDALVARGFTCTWVPVDPLGRVDPEAMREAITDSTCLVCIHHASHDLGTVQPLNAIGAVCAGREVPLFVDATASAGWLPLDVNLIQAGLVALAPHRFHGPQGVGILYRHRAVPLQPLLHGGDQEHGLRAGSENLPAMVGAGVAAVLATRELLDRTRHTLHLQQRVLDGLRSRVQGLRLNGPEPGPGRSPVNLHLTVEGVEGEALVLRLDLQGLAIHSGAACVTRSLRVPAALQAIGLDAMAARCSVLLGPGRDTTEAEVDHAVELFAAAVTRLRDLTRTFHG